MKGDELGKWEEYSRSVQDAGRDLRSHIPEVYDSHAAMSKAIYVDGALSAETKELMALVAAVVQGCTGCIAAHARNSARMKISDEKVAEALGVAIHMHGGPGVSYGAEAWQAFSEFKQRYSR